MENQDNQISITWDGNSWQVETSVPTSRIRPGETIFTAIPDSALLPEETGGDEVHLMFPAGTFLYLPLNAVRNVEELERIWQAHRAEVHPPLARTNRLLVPIQVLEDLILEPAGTQYRLRAAKCRIPGRELEEQSLNSIATKALFRYTDRETGAIGVFREVRFIHAKSLIPIDHRRAFLIDGTPLPEPKNPEDGTPPLFGDME